MPYADAKDRQSYQHSGHLDNEHCGVRNAEDSGLVDDLKTVGTSEKTISLGEEDSKEEEDASNIDDDDDIFEEDIALLISYSFLSFATSRTVFEMHRLVQLATQRWLKTQEHFERWKDRFITILSDAFPTGEYRNWAVCHTMFPHVQSAEALNPTRQKMALEWAVLMYRAAWYAESKGAFPEAEKMARLSVQTRIKTLGHESTMTLSSIRMLASTFRNQGRWKEAEELEVQALETRKRMLGEEHPDTLTSMGNLASTYWN